MFLYLGRLDPFIVHKDPSYNWVTLKPSVRPSILVKTRDYKHPSSSVTTGSECGLGRLLTFSVRFRCSSSLGLTVHVTLLTRAVTSATFLLGSLLLWCDVRHIGTMCTWENGTPTISHFRSWETWCSSGTCVKSGTTFLLINWVLTPFLSQNRPPLP